MEDNATAKWETASPEKIGYIVHLLKILQLGAGDLIGKDLNKILFTELKPASSLLDFTQMLVDDDVFWESIPEEIKSSDDEPNEFMAKFFGSKNREELKRELNIYKTEYIRKRLGLLLALCDQKLGESID